MIIKEEGAKRFAPLRLHSNRRDNFLYEPSLEMIEWYYGNSNTKVLCYEKVDDKCSVVCVEEVFGSSVKRKSFTIGRTEKRLIYETFNFYHNG